MRKENLPPIVAAIQSIDPDIVGLQEVRAAGQPDFGRSLTW